MLLLVSLLFLHPARADNLGTQFQWHQSLGTRIPAESVFTDETGRLMPLVALFGRPVILDLGYFHCPALCGTVRADLFDSLRKSGLVAGRDYTMLALSIDPREHPSDAMEAKHHDLQAAALAGDASALHYLTGSDPEIASVTEAAGFPDRFDDSAQQFLHPPGLVILTASFTISSYLPGLGYQPGDIRDAVLRAEKGIIGRQAQPVMLLCFDFDPETGRYTVTVAKMLRLGIVLALLMLGGVLAFMHRRAEQIR